MTELIPTLKRVGHGLLLAVLALSATWWTLSTLTGDALSIVRQINYASPWVGMLLFISGLAAISIKRMKLGVVTLIVALLVLAPYQAQLGRFFVGMPHSAEDGSPTLRVLSYNTMLRNHDVAAISDVILGHRPDIALLQEVLSPVELGQRLAGLYEGAPVHVVSDEYLRLMIVSRFPIRAQESRNEVQRAIVSPPGSAAIMLRNLHAVRGTNDDTDQLEFVENLVADISSVYEPLIVAGDFNMTESNEGYGMISDWLKNTHEEAGVGFGFTFATPQRRFGTLMPLIRIDHMFVSRHFDVLEAGRLAKFGNSDHFPIEAVLSLSSSSRL